MEKEEISGCEIFPEQKLELPEVEGMLYVVSPKVSPRRVCNREP